MELRHVRAFVAVAEELHFGRAAARLHVAQPAVSQTIAQLERELGVSLFDRTNRRVELTDAGRSLLEDARGVVDRAESLRADAARIRTGTTGSVVVGVAPALPPNALTDVLSLARRRCPEVRVVAKALTRSLESALGDSRFDLVLARGPISAPGVATTLVADEPLGVALPQSHRLAARKTLRAKQLAGEDVATFTRDADPGAFDRLFGALGAAGFAGGGALHESPPGAVEASLRLVAAGAAISFKLQSEVVAFGSDAVVWRPLADVALTVEVHLAWRIDLSNPAARRVAAAVADRASVEAHRPGT